MDLSEKMCRPSNISRPVVYELVSAGYIGGLFYWSGDGMNTCWLKLRASVLNVLVM
jgi:hypothetical protein